MRFLLFFKPFFYFEKLHRHTLKTLFNCERHINVLPFWGSEERNRSTVSSIPSFPPSRVVLPISVPNLLPLKDDLTQHQAKKSYFSTPMMSSILLFSFLLHIIVILYPHRRHHSFFVIFLFFFLVIIFHLQFVFSVCWNS